MAAYYNEIDPYAAQWLRNLIKAGHIAHGDVDERSIVDVRADDLKGYSQCHFFAGIGGWSIALRLAGWPDDGPVWTGSCPCQPFSAAGAGKAADDERHLWPAWFPLIRECKPAIVFGEQVEAAVGWGWIDAVFADLEGEGYACGTTVLPACGVGAPHIRQRLWFVADAQRGGVRIGPGSADGSQEEIRREVGQQRLRSDLLASGDSLGPMADAMRSRAGDASGQGLGTQEAIDCQDGSLSGERLRPRMQGATGSVADANGEDAGTERLQRGGEQRQRAQGGGAGELGNAESSDGRLSERQERQPHSEFAGPSEACDMGHANGSRRTLGIRIAGNDAAPVGASGRQAVIQAGPLRGFWSDAEWIACTDGKARPVGPGSFPLGHGIQRRASKLRAYGNAIVPQAAQAFIQAMMESRP